MEWFNIFLSTQFLTTDYIYYLKQISIVCVFALIFFIFTYIFGDAIKHLSEQVDSAFKFFSGIAFIVAAIAFVVVVLGFFILPVAYFAAILKDLFIAKYLYTPELLTFPRELLVNLLMSFVSAFVYMHIVIWILENFMKENSK